jgi:dihydrodipicolinate synthase/N-acetylneuraminate lyase
MNLSGVFAPLPTPFDERDEVDLARLRAALPRWVASPLTGFIVLGSNGEVGMMSDDECDRVVETARGLVPRGRPFVVGATRESTPSWCGRPACSSRR